MVLGLLLVMLGNGLVNFAEMTVSSGLAAVAIASMPLLGRNVQRLLGRHPSRLRMAGPGLGFAGVVWLNVGSAMSASVPGMLALLAATLSLGLRLGLEPRPRPGGAFHDYSGADAVRRRDDAGVLGFVLRRTHA